MNLYISGQVLGIEDASDAKTARILDNDMLDPLGVLAGVRKTTKAAARDIRALERKGVVPTESNGGEKSRGSASIDLGNNEEGGKKGEGPGDVSAFSEAVQKGANASKGGRENAADR